MNEVDKYITGFPAEVQERLIAIRSLVFELAPQVTERISWGMPSYSLNGKFLVHFAGFKKHIGFYNNMDELAPFKEKLTGYKTSKGTIQFPLNKPLPLNLIREIIGFQASKNDVLTKPVIL